MPPSRRAISASRSRLMLRLLEIPQIGGRLSLAGGHQVAVTAHEVRLADDADMVVALGPERFFAWPSPSSGRVGWVLPQARRPVVPTRPCFAKDTPFAPSPKPGIRLVPRFHLDDGAAVIVADPQYRARAVVDHEDAPNVGIARQQIFDDLVGLGVESCDLVGQH